MLPAYRLSPFPIVAVVFLGRIAGRPVDHVELGVVAAGEPCRRAAVLDVLPLPRLRSGCSGLRHRPESPDLPAGLLIVGRDEPVRAVLAARDARDHEVARRQRRRRGGVVLPPVVERRIPQELAAEPVEGDDVRVVGFHEDAIARDPHAAVHVVDHGGGLRPLVVPDLAAAPGVERVALVGIGDIHDPADDDRRDLRAAHAGNREDPFRAEPHDGALVDLRRRRVTVPARIAVVGRPVRLRGHFTHAIARAAQQVHALVAGPQLHVFEALAEHLPIESHTRGGLEGQSSKRPRVGAALNRAQELHEIGHLGSRDDARGHAPVRHPFVNQLDQLPVVARGEAQHDRRTHLTAVAVGAVAPGAAVLERLASRIDGLRVQ